MHVYCTPQSTRIAQRAFLLATLFGWVAATAAVGLAAEMESGVLAAGTPHESAYFVQRADEPGPTVLLVGGVHGDEPAGVHALEVVRRWPIRRGTLVVVPAANPTALAAGKRRMPDEPRSRSDLNRDFPQPGEEDDASPEHPLAGALWELIDRCQPDWVIDVHEGYGFHQITPKSVGSSVIADQRPETQAMAAALLETVNADIAEADKKFVPLSPPVSGSLARAASEFAGAKAMILETTIQDQRIPVRARQHRRMLCEALSRLEMLEATVTADTLIAPEAGDDVIQVGLFDDVGVGGKGVPNLEQQLAAQGRMRTVRVDGEDIRRGACDEFDVLIFSGGSGSRQGKSLGEEGRDKVRDFVDRGGVYVGVCAGGYLASDGFSWGLGVLDVRTKSPKWRRGRAHVEVELTEDGRRLLPADQPASSPVLYANGPIWEDAGRDDLPDAEVLAWFRTEVARNGTPAGIMVDSPAYLRGRYGDGQVVAFSCHPEQTEGCENVVAEAILSVGQVEAVGQ